MSLFSLIEESLSLNRPFVAYRKPGSDQVCMLIQNDTTLHYVEDFSESGFVMAPFLKADGAVLIRPDVSFQFAQSFDQEQNSGVHKTTNSGGTDKDRHLKLVSKARRAINSGILKKVVLARKIVLEIDLKPLRVFQDLCTAHPDAFCYYWHHPEIGSWLGASPELLLSLQNNTLETNSLAGTMKYSEGIEPDWGAKEVEEQQLVTDFIVDSLQQISIHSKTSEKEQVLAGKLWHLKSVIRADASKSQLETIIGALHPTPAVCGIPRERATAFITNNEGLDRKFYTGFLGEINMGNEQETNLFVNLRCMEYSGQQVSIYVGGGITDLSDPELEWQETEAKSQTILNALLNYVK